MTKHRKKQQDRLTAAAVSGKPFADAWRNFTRHPVSMIAMCVLIVLILTAIVSGFAFDYDKDIVAINPAERMQAPNANHWFGTDDFGRDLFARILYGSRYSLFIGITVSAIAMVLGMLIGASCAYFGGVYDALVMRLMDAIICIPSMLLMLALVTELIVRPHPWYAPQLVVPLTGMLLGNTVTALAVGLSRFYESMEERRDEVDMMLALGATPWESARPSIVSSIRLGLLPTTASLASSGIVTIPGMMAGQVIAGGDPLNAAKYQFVVLDAIAALTLLADGLIMVMIYRTCFTADDQYRPPEAR